jgi:hypothetical protein
MKATKFESIQNAEIPFSKTAQRIHGHLTIRVPYSHESSAQTEAMRAIMTGPFIILRFIISFQKHLSVQCHTEHRKIDQI